MGEGVSHTCKSKLILKKWAFTLFLLFTISCIIIAYHVALQVNHRRPAPCTGVPREAEVEFLVLHVALQVVHEDTADVDLVATRCHREPATIVRLHLQIPEG